MQNNGHYASYDYSSHRLWYQSKIHMRAYDITIVIKYVTISYPVILCPAFSCLATWSVITTSCNVLHLQRRCQCQGPVTLCRSHAPPAQLRQWRINGPDYRYRYSYLYRAYKSLGCNRLIISQTLSSTASVQAITPTQIIV